MRYWIMAVTGTTSFTSSRISLFRLSKGLATGRSGQESPRDGSSPTIGASAPDESSNVEPAPRRSESLLKSDTRNLSRPRELEGMHLHTLRHPRPLAQPRVDRSRRALALPNRPALGGPRPGRRSAQRPTDGVGLIWHRIRSSGHHAGTRNDEGRSPRPDRGQSPSIALLPRLPTLPPSGTRINAGPMRIRVLSCLVT
jgi:hypothetical protein